MTPSTRTQRVFVWAGPLMMGLWIAGWAGFANLIPPPSPGESAEAIASFYRDNPHGIRAGLIMSVVASTLLAPFVAVIALQLRRAEGRSGGWTQMQILLGALLPIVFIMPLYNLMTASFRIDREPTEIQALNDLGWVPFIGLVTTATFQLFAIAMAIFKDQRENPVFPRWVGFFNLWVALMFCPGITNVYFEGGPLSWPGLFAWWVPLTSFGIWIAVMTAMLLRAIQHQEHEEASGRFVEAFGVDGPRVDLDVLMTELVAHLARNGQRMPDGLALGPTVRDQQTPSADLQPASEPRSLT